MMKGSNKFVLNEATMKEALQYWLDNVVFSVDERQAVTAINNNIDGEHTWTIKLDATKGITNK